MNRIATTLTALTASVLFPPTSGAAEPTLQSLESRLGTLESRLISIEKALTEDRGAHSYNSAATIEATNGVSAISAAAPAPEATKPLSAPAPAPAPAPAAQTTPAAAAAGQTYVIQDGDTLGKIAGKFQIERKSLLEANRLSEGQPIYIGETLLIPGAAPAPVQDKAPAEVAGATPPAPVKQEAIVVGETKKPAPATATTHKVAKGDTLTSLAKKFGTTVESLKSANGLRSDTISLGQNLKIPSAKPAGTMVSNAAPAPKSGQSAAFEYDNPLLSKNETYGYYTVVNGDNLYALARDFFTTMGELQRVNNLGSSTIIRPGDEIIVPTSKYNAFHKTGEVANR
jgi:LysM repeat protein